LTGSTSIGSIIVLDNRCNIYDGTILHEGDLLGASDAVILTSSFSPVTNIKFENVNIINSSDSSLGYALYKQDAELNGGRFFSNGSGATVYSSGFGSIRNMYCETEIDGASAFLHAAGSCKIDDLTAISLATGNSSIGINISGGAGEIINSRGETFGGNGSIAIYLPTKWIGRNLYSASNSNDPNVYAIDLSGSALYDSYVLGDIFVDNSDVINCTILGNAFITDRCGFIECTISSGIVYTVDDASNSFTNCALIGGIQSSGVDNSVINLFNCKSGAISFGPMPGSPGPSSIINCIIEENFSFSGFSITGATTAEVKISGVKFTGSNNNGWDTSTVTQMITNTEDNQGNIIAQ
jgi:hypothetical protein